MSAPHERAAKARAELDAKLLGEQIAKAIDAQPDVNRAKVAGELGISPDTLDRWILGKTNPNVIEVWQIAAMTRQTLSWFAGIEDGPPTEGFAAAADLLQSRIKDMASMLTSFENDLVALRRLAVRAAVDESKAERAAALRRKRDAL